MLRPEVAASLTPEPFPDAAGGPVPALSLEALGVPLNDRLDRHCRLAAEVLETSVALITRVSAGDQCVAASVGLASSQTGWAGPLAAQASSYRLLEIPDMRRDARCALNPLVTEPPRLRCFAGTELCSRKGRAPLGTLCVMDETPRRLTESQCRVFLRLADLVEQDLMLEVQLSNVSAAATSEAMGPDPVTGAPASVCVADYASSQLVQARAAGCGLAAVAVNVSGLEQIAGIYGAEVADALLEAVKARLRPRLPAASDVIRLDVTWLVVLLRVDAATEDFIGLVRSLADVLAPPYDLKAVGTVHSGFRLGVATAFPGDSVGGGDLLSRACEAARQVGANGGFAFHPSAG